MNIEQAKMIPLIDVLHKLEFYPVKLTNHIAEYISPIRDTERTASFKVYLKTNRWCDFGTGKKGDTVDFVKEWLEYTKESHTTHDALRWFGNMMVVKPLPKPIKAKDDSKPESIYRITDKKAIEHPRLIHYLKTRCIPLEIAKVFVKELRVYNSQSKKSFFALGFKNESKGYEVRNPIMKTCIGKKDVTFIRGTKPKPDGIHIFEGFMDYLSAITCRKGEQFEYDTIVLNSLVCIGKASELINNYGYKIVYTYLDNDKAGAKALKALDEFFKTEPGLTHKPQNHLYDHFKDMNECLVNRAP